MKSPESWESYYHKDNITSFNEHRPGYFGSITRLQRQNPDFLRGYSKAFLLGGYFPTNSTQYDFVTFCRDIRDVDAVEEAGGDTSVFRPQKFEVSQNDVYILADINKRSLLTYEQENFPDKAPEPVRVQADLSRLPFSESLDLICIDHTLQFMPDEAVKEAGKSFQSALKKNAAVIVMNDEPFLGPYNRLVGRVNAGRRIYPRKDREIVELFAEDLKPILRADNSYQMRFGTYSTLVFGRHDSGYEIFEGNEPISFT